MTSQANIPYKSKTKENTRDFSGEGLEVARLRRVGKDARINPTES